MNAGLRPRAGETTAGILLIAVGAVFLITQVLEVNLARVGWPFFVIGPGVVLVLLGLSGPAGFLYPGTIVTTVGALLLVQNATGRWATWAYAWALIVVAIGAAQLLHGARAHIPEVARAGRRTVVSGLVMLALGAAFFEGVLHLSGVSFDPYGGAILSGLLIIAGVGMLAERLRPGRGS